MVKEGEMKAWKDEFGGGRILHHPSCKGFAATAYNVGVKI